VFRVTQFCTSRRTSARRPRRNPPQHDGNLGLVKGHEGKVRFDVSFNIELESVVTLFARDASDVDGAESVPAEHFDALARIGLYGAFAPNTEGGLGLSLVEMCDVVERLAAACLASTFVWIQHFRLLAGVLDPNGPPDLREQLSRVVAGQNKGGVALTGQLPGPAKLQAAPGPKGWSLSGTAPWVSGWGMVDTLIVAARGPDDTVVTCFLDAHDQAGLASTRHHLSALNATATVRLDFVELVVPAERFLNQFPYDPSSESPEGLRVNGSLALGVTRRCCQLIGPSRLDLELSQCRAALDAASTETMPLTRARACELAVRASHALAVERGSSSVIKGDIAERTAREATLLLTFGSRPLIKRALLETFGASKNT
jgi:alkylation response protein AidB-like acyl-CoA dehydrogenase